MVIQLVLNALAILIAAYVVPGINVDSVFTALVVAVFLGLMNIFVKPLLVIVTLPINVLTLGLFTLIINGLLILLVGNIVSGFQVQDFWSAVLFGLVLSLVGFFLNTLKK